MKLRTDKTIQHANLTGQLRLKSRQRREKLPRMAHATAISPSPRNDLLPGLEVTYVSVQGIRPSARKLRKLDPAHVTEVAASIGSFGLCDPILVGRDFEVIDGEARYEAAKLLGLERVPCIRIEHLSKDQQRLLRLATNRLAEKGQWDLDELKIEFEELIVAGTPIEVSGFALCEIDQILLPGDENSIEEGALAPDPSVPAIARLGDAFRLGRHRIACGDAADQQVLQRLMQGDTLAQLILTDEPYNVPIAGNVTRGAHREFMMASGEMSDEEFVAFNIAWMAAGAAYLCDGGILGTFIDWRGHPKVMAAASKVGLNPLNLVVWCKTNAGMGSLYRSAHELLPLFKKGTAPHVNNVELGKHGRWRSNVWTYPGASSLGSDARRGLRDHPTTKPTALLEDALLDLTNRDDIVIDPFLGSGSTLIAAERSGRICRGVELDPLYVDVIIRRFETVTGDAAVLIETGERYSDLATRRTANAIISPAGPQT